MENDKIDVFGDKVEILNTTTTADERIESVKKKEKEEKMTFNPMTVSLQTLNVGHNPNDLECKKDKTIENYYSQIKSNLYCSVKSHFLIARDLYDAKVNLDQSEFVRLIEQLKFTGTTQSKYLSIGKDLRLWKLFTQGVLPFKWTTQYFLTTLTDTQFNKVAEMIDAETPMGKIKKVADVGKAEVKMYEDALLQILALEIDKDEVKSVSAFENLYEKVLDVLHKYVPEISINQDKYEKAVEKIAKIVQKKDLKIADQKTAQNVIRNASTINTASA